MNKEQKSQRSGRRGEIPGSGALLPAENNVIGMALNDRDNFRRSWALGVRSHHFSEPTNRVLWDALREGAVERLDAGYPVLIERLSGECPLTQNVEFYAAPLIVARIELRFREQMCSALRHFPPDPGEVARLMAKMEERMAKLRKWEGYRGEEAGQQGGRVSPPRKRHKQERQIQSREPCRGDLQTDFNNLRQ